MKYNPLPKLMAVITRHPRYIPKIEWSGGKLVTHDVFRLYELLFGRRFGIRIESSVEPVLVDGKVVDKHNFYTVEAFLVFWECAIRDYLKNLEFGFEFVRLPSFQLAGLMGQEEDGIRIPIFVLAIANTGTENTGFTASGTTCSRNISTSGSDRAVIGAVWTWNAAQTYTTTTYAGVTMSELGTRAGDFGDIRLVGCHDATTGSNAMISNTSGSMQHFTTAAAYSGVASGSAAAAFPDTAASGTTTSTTVTGTMTTSVANSWVFLHGRTPSRAMTAGANTYARATNTTSGDAVKLFDSNADRASGSNSLIYTWSPSQTTYWVMNSMAPAGGGGGAITPTLTMLGIGS